MTYASALGCLLIAFGPTTAVLLLVVARSPKLLILCIGAGFFWLCGLIVSSVLWYAVAPLRPYLLWSVPLAVLLSEVFRLLFWLLWTRGQTAIAQDAGKIVTSPSAQFTESVAAGLGAGMTAALVLYGGVLWNGWGPGMLPSVACPTLSVFFVGAWSSLGWTLLHTFWTVLAFRGYYRGSVWRVGLVAASHAAVALLTLLNGVAGVAGLCAVPLLGQALAVLLVGWVVSRDLRADYDAIVLKRK